MSWSRCRKTCASPDKLVSEHRGRQQRSAQQEMNWTDLCARASVSVARSQWLLDRAWAAAKAAHNGAIDTVLGAELPTAVGLCLALDAHGVEIPRDVLSKFHGYLAPSPTRACSRSRPDLDSIARG